MNGKLLKNWMCRGATCCALTAPLVAALAFAAPARADGYRVVTSQCETGYGTRYGGHSRYRSFEQIESERGYAAGSRAGWREGWEDGYHGRGSDCHCAIDLSCETRWYRRAFIAAFERSYNAGYRAGALQRERERCSTIRYPYQSW